MPRLLRRAVAPISVLSVALLALAGCTGSTDPGPKATRTHSSQATAAAPTPDLQEFYSQQVSWAPCSEADECATVTVPLDYADPTGPTVDLAIARILAQGDAVGSILVNPGGPGASAIDFLSSAPYLFSAELLDEYDIVAFDPRGVSRTTSMSRAAVTVSTCASASPVFFAHAAPKAPHAAVCWATPSSVDRSKSAAIRVSIAGPS